MFETHVLEDKFKMFEIYFKNYTLFWISASKIHSSGRPSGGCLFGFKKQFQKSYMLKFCNLFNNPVLRAQFNGEIFYFIPRYLNCTNWKNDFDKFYNFIHEFKENNFCIVGDLNARLSDKQILDDNLLNNLPQYNNIRMSNDKKLNGEGKKLYELIEDIGGIILNGRTKGDFAGDFTFIGGRGNSVIDYSICSHSFLHLVDTMSVGSDPFFDHLPIRLNLKFLSRNVVEKTRSKLSWNRKNSVKYSQKLGLLATNVDLQSTISTDDLIDSITNKVKEANSSNSQKPFFEGKQPWFDCKCARYRKQLTKALNTYKNQYSEYNKQVYLTSKTLKN